MIKTFLIEVWKEVRDHYETWREYREKDKKTKNVNIYMNGLEKDDLTFIELPSL